MAWMIKIMRTFSFAIRFVTKQILSDFPFCLNSFPFCLPNSVLNFLIHFQLSLVPSWIRRFSASPLSHRSPVRITPSRQSNFRTWKWSGPSAWAALDALNWWGSRSSLFFVIFHFSSSFYLSFNCQLLKEIFYLLTLYGFNVLKSPPVSLFYFFLLDFLTINWCTDV